MSAGGEEQPVLKPHVLPSALSVQAYIKGWKVSPLTWDTCPQIAKIPHGHLSGRAGNGQEQEIFLLFCPLTPLFFLALTPGN